MEVATFALPGEARLAQALLRNDGIDAVLSSDLPSWGARLFNVPDGVRLIVPAGQVEQAHAVLGAEVSDEELAAQAEAEAAPEE